MGWSIHTLNGNQKILKKLKKWQKTLKESIPENPNQLELLWKDRRMNEELIKRTKKRIKNLEALTDNSKK